MAADDYAIVVGINQYPGLLSPPLQGPEHDASNFAAWLTDPAKGAVPRDNVSLILSKAFAAADPLDARPATTEVDSAFERLVRQGQNNGGVAGRRLYIFLAGHGFAPFIEDAALLTANVNFLVGTTGHHISGRSYANWFRESGLFQEIVLIMDYCRDDMPIAPVRKPPWEPIRNPRGGRVAYLFGFATPWRGTGSRWAIVPESTPNRRTLSRSIRSLRPAVQKSLFSDIPVKRPALFTRSSRRSTVVLMCTVERQA